MTWTPHDELKVSRNAWAKHWLLTSVRGHGVAMASGDASAERKNAGKTKATDRLSVGLTRDEEIGRDVTRTRKRVGAVRSGVLRGFACFSADFCEKSKLHELSHQQLVATQQHRLRL